MRVCRKCILTVKYNMETKYQLQAVLLLCIRGPILPMSYKIGPFQIEVSYPKSMYLFNRRVAIPFSLCTRLKISWEEKSKIKISDFVRDGQKYQRRAFELCLLAANQFFSAFKLAKINHTETAHLRTVGEVDALYYFVKMNGKQIGSFLSSPALSSFHDARMQTVKAYSNKGIKKIKVAASFDPSSITLHAIRHLGGVSSPISRRFVRCFELQDHGYYTEALIVSFSILDDLIQQSIIQKMNSLSINEKSAKEIIRAIKDNRMKMFLGGLLKLLCGNSVLDKWDNAEKAIDYINGKRNSAAHAGFTANKSESVICINICIRILREISELGLIEHDFDHEMIYYSNILVSFLEEPPSWLDMKK